MFIIDNNILFMDYLDNNIYIIFLGIFGFLWFLSTVIYILSVIDWKRKKQTWYYLYLKTAVYGTSWLVIIVINLIVDRINQGGF